MSYKSLEDFLLEGEISVSEYREHLFRAGFMFYDVCNSPIYVDSHRGVQHILLLLHSELLRTIDEEAATDLLSTADHKYLYGINYMNMTPLDKIVIDAHMQIFRTGSMISIICREKNIPLKETLPGIYMRKAIAPQINLALQNILHTSPVHQPTEQKVLQT